MFDTDMAIGYVLANGTAVAHDYYSKAHEMPSLDTALGGEDNVVAVCGAVDRANNVTVLRVRRPLAASDKFDKALSPAQANGLVYAWGSDAPVGQIGFHGDNHNFIRVNFTAADGFPSTPFGREERGQAARDFVAAHRVGTLATLQTEQAAAPGIANWPYASVASYADTNPPSGRPYILLSTLERNIINLQANPKMALAIHTLVTDYNTSEPMSQPRCTLFGNLLPVPAAELPAARQRYLELHPLAQQWITFADFTLYQLDVLDVYWVGGFGNDHAIMYIPASQYLAANSTAAGL